MLGKDMAEKVDARSGVWQRIVVQHLAAQNCDVPSGTELQCAWQHAVTRIAAGQHHKRCSACSSTDSAM